MTSPGAGTGSGRSSIASCRLKRALFAPIPRATESAATAVKPGVLASIRNA
jgi:hypothetical protein